MAGKKGGGHHGGAWKVAYADFVTAMMALFMVLWITSQDPKILKSTADYFKNPHRPIYTGPAGLMPPSSTSVDQSIKDTTKSESIPNARLLERIARDFYKALNLDSAASDNPVDVVATPEGLKITVYDRARRPTFVKDTAQLTEWGDLVMQNLAWLVDRHRFKVIIEGHTPKGYKPPKPDYGMWELTADRANAARRALELYAVSSAQIKRVTGCADTQPLPDNPPTSDVNARITLGLSINPNGSSDLVANRDP